MPKNMPETTRFGYNNEEHTRSYSEKISDLRRNDENISDNVKLRDQYFKIIEDTGYSKNRNEEYLNTQVPFSALENRKLEEDMSQEDRAILRQERRDDPTIDDISENEELANYQYHENIKDDFEDILSSIDKDSEEYQDIEKVENLITKLTNSDSIELYEYDDFDITLDNPNLDENVYLQFKGENNNYVIDYQNFVEKNDERLEIDITKDNIEYSELEVEYDKYKDKAINIAEKFPEDVNKIERELENYDFASEKYNEYLKNKYTDFNQYLKDNNISNPYEKYSDDLIKNTKTYSDIRLKMEEIDDEHFSQHGKHVSNYIDYSEEIKSTPQNLQKLKSVELEKNVIGLLPKEQQENKFKETLSRLEKNKSSLKDNLKNYMSNEKIDNAINSVKQHFENIKVKAEDVQQTFKDLGQWNTENKFVKDIDNVINSVKDLGKKHENELLQSDSNSIMSKLNNEYLELKEFVNKAEQDNNTFKEEQNIRSEFVSKMLNAKQIEIDFDPKEVTKDLSENQKLEVYNQLKDLNHHYQNNASTTSLVKEQENKIIIKNLEEDNPEFINKRQEHVTLKQSLQPIKIETTSEKLDNIIKDSNKDIKKMDGLDKKNFKESKNKEKTITNQNSQSSKIKSNDMFKKMEKLNQQTINENTEKKEPKISRQSMTR